MNKEALFSSNSDEWATPADVFAMLDREFQFTLDPCATLENHKTAEYFTKEQDGLLQAWGGIAYFAIHRIAGSVNGSRSVIRKDKRKIPSLSY